MNKNKNRNRKNDVGELNDVLEKIFAQSLSYICNLVVKAGRDAGIIRGAGNVTNENINDVCRAFAREIVSPALVNAAATRVYYRIRYARPYFPNLNIENRPNYKKGNGGRREEV